MNKKPTYKGKPCPAGHTERYVKTRRCAVCQRGYVATYQLTDAGKEVQSRATKKYSASHKGRGHYRYTPVAKMTPEQHAKALIRWRNKYRPIQGMSPEEQEVARAKWRAKRKKK